MESNDEGHYQGRILGRATVCQAATMGGHHRCNSAYRRRIQYGATLGPWEKHVAIRLIWIVVAGGWYLLCSLQCHLRNTRLAIDPDDAYPLLRGADVVIGMAGAMIISAAAVCYSLLWRDGAYHLLLRMQGQVY